MIRPMAVKTVSTTLAAREAQRLFFQIGMVQRTLIGAAFTELGLTFAQAHALPAASRPGPAVAHELIAGGSAGRKAPRT